MFYSAPNSNYLHTFTLRQGHTLNHTSLTQIQIQSTMQCLFISIIALCKSCVPGHAVMSLICPCVFPGAPHRERGCSAAEGQTPQHHHADRGGGHSLWTLPGYGTCQGTVEANGGDVTAQSSSLCLMVNHFFGTGRRFIRCHHLLGQIHRERRQCHGVQSRWGSEVPAQHQHRPQRHQTRELAGIYLHAPVSFIQIHLLSGL